MSHRDIPRGRRLHFGGGVRTLLPALALLGLAAVASLWPDPFVLDRHAVEAGEIWRLWTGHFVHLTRDHFVWDVGIGALMMLVVPWRRGLLVLPPLVGLAMLGLRPDLDVYTGLSGVLHGMTALAAIEFARRGRGLERYVAIGILAGVLAKSVFEGVTGASLLTSAFDMGSPVAFEAHLCGVLGGLLLALLPTRWNADEQSGCAGACTAAR